MVRHQADLAAHWRNEIDLAELIERLMTTAAQLAARRSGWGNLVAGMPRRLHIDRR